jgi:hypothetical protein
VVTDPGEPPPAGTTVPIRSLMGLMNRDRCPEPNRTVLRPSRKPVSETAHLPSAEMMVGQDASIILARRSGFEMNLVRRSMNSLIWTRETGRCVAGDRWPMVMRVGFGNRQSMAEVLFLHCASPNQERRA